MAKVTLVIETLVKMSAKLEYELPEGADPTATARRLEKEMQGNDFDWDGVSVWEPIWDTQDAPQVVAMELGDGEIVYTDI